MKRATLPLALFAAGVLSASLAASADAAFPGRNGRIAYVHEQDDYGFGGGDSEVSEIWSVLPNGTRRRTILGFNRGGFAQPAYSPDGRKLAVSDGEFASGSSLYLVRASGRGRLRRLTRHRERRYDLTPGWAPDGRRLVYFRYSNAAHCAASTCAPPPAQVRVYRAGKSRRIAAAENAFSQVHPVWSARGRIAFSSGGGIYTTRPDGSHRRRVVGGYHPDWSPRGHWIVYGLPTTPLPVGGGGIALIRPDGSRQRTLTSEGRDPAFSPDGRYIAFTRQESDRWTLVAMRLRDRRMRTIATAPPISNPSPMHVEEHLLLAPTWQPLPRRRHR